MRSQSAFGDPARNRTAAPFMRALGTVWLGGDATGVTLRLPCVPATCGGVHRDAIDLRGVAAVLDHAGGAAVYAALDGARATATLELRLDFLGVPAPGKDLFASAGCAALETGCALIHGQAWCEDAAAPVARMSGRFIVGTGPGQWRGAAQRQPRLDTAARERLCRRLLVEGA